LDAELLERSEELRRRVFGDEDPLTLRSSRLLAYTVNGQGRYKEVEKRYRSVLTSQIRILGEEHPDTLVTMNSLAVVLEAEQATTQAGELYRRVLETRRRVLGNDNEATLWSLGNLGYNLWQQRKYKESEALLRAPRRRGLSQCGQALPRQPLKARFEEVRGPPVSPEVLSPS
jgi:Tetratricopeptide repeat